MKTWCLSMSLIAVWFWIPSLMATAAQPHGGNAVANKKKEVQAAKDRLQSARKEAEAARTAAVHAVAELKNAERHAKDVRESVQAEHDSATELVAARAKWEQDKQTLTQLSEPLLAKVREGAEYQTALADRDAARKAGQPRQFSDAIAAIKKLETAAIEADPQAKAAAAAAGASELKLQGLVKVRDEAIAKDKRFLDARQAIDKARSAAESAQKKAANEQRDLAGAERKVHDLERQLHDLEHPKTKAKKKH